MDFSKMIDFSVGWNGNVYLLFSDQPPERIIDDDGCSFVNTEAFTAYTVVELTVHWNQKRLLDITAFPLGIQRFNYHYIQSLGEDFLLVGARCYYQEGNPEKNGLIIGRDVVVKNRICLGDGIQNCVVKSDGTIITGYFDEGVFGNCGWDEPIGCSGLIAWDQDGNILWENENYGIIDCYAISLDQLENLWFYYYDTFDLVKTDFVKEEEFQVPISGSGAFAVHPSGQSVLFQGGYGKERKFFSFVKQKGRLGAAKEVALIAGEKWISAVQCSLLRHRMLFLSEDGILYGHKLGEAEDF